MKDKNYLELIEKDPDCLNNKTFYNPHDESVSIVLTYTPDLCIVKYLSMWDDSSEPLPSCSVLREDLEIFLDENTEITKSKFKQHLNKFKTNFLKEYNNQFSYLYAMKALAEGETLSDDMYSRLA